MLSEAKEDVTACAGFLLEPAAHGDDLVARDTQLGIRMVRRIPRRSAFRPYDPDPRLKCQQYPARRAVGAGLRRTGSLLA